MWHELLTILFPSPCLVCGYLEESLCTRCRERLPFFPHQRTLVLPDGELFQVFSALYYDQSPLLEELVHGLKYAHHSDLKRYLIPPMREALRLLLDPSDLIFVPVPLFAHRERERGYNQAELLAEVLARATGRPLWKGLQRVRDTGSQVLVKGRMERQSNIRNAFQVVGPAPLSSQLVLVDDIVTTGSTLLECRHALMDVGATQVLALTLADREPTPTCPWDRCLPQRPSPSHGSGTV